MVQQTSRLPVDKLQVLRALIHTFQGCHKVTLHELQQLLGYLNITCKVIAPGRAFLRRLCDATRGLRLPHYWVHVTAGMRDDLAV